MVNVEMNPRAVYKLIGLLNYLYDSQKGYKECARVIRVDGLRPVLISEANQRILMIHIIQKQLQNITKKLSLRGTFITGPIHRLYLNLRALITLGDKTKLLKEIKRGDSALANTYKEVLQEDLPAELNHALHVQLIHFEETIRDLDKITL